MYQHALLSTRRFSWFPFDNIYIPRRKASALGFDDKFIRTWEYYLSYAAALFKSRTAIDYQVRA
jgi:cyclopropane fatty-acyl-phospholipid synthase-like methyltransferase